MRSLKTKVRKTKTKKIKSDLSQTEVKFISSILIPLLFFLGSLYANYLAITYATLGIGNSTTDILLDNLPVINTDMIFSEGALLLVISVIIIFFRRPKTVPFALKSLGLLVYFRSVFITMTHLAPYPDRIMTDLSNFSFLSADADLFFSGHTAVPFMLGLIYWQNKRLRLSYIIASVVAGIAVLLGHLHYSIDVFSAYFIAYGTYIIAQRLFKKDYKRLEQSLLKEGK